MSESKKQRVKQRLIGAIASGAYPPGTCLRQNTIAQELGLSSTPVREAFTDLQASGLLVHASNRGFRVVELDEQRVRHVYQARRIVEAAAARLAVDHVSDADVRKLERALDELRAQRSVNDLTAMVAVNERLQRGLYGLCANPCLIDAIERLWNSIPRYLPWVVEDRQDESLLEHGSVLSALAKRDRDGIAAAIEQHLRNAERHFIDYLTASSPTTTENEHEH